MLTRRVPNRLWIPLVALGILTLAIDFLTGGPVNPFERQLVLLRVGISVGVVAPLGYIFSRVGVFGGADAKAVLVLALLFPVYPVYFLPSTALPLNAAPFGVFSLTIVSNSVIVAVFYPVALALQNLLRGRVGLLMAIGIPVSVSSLATAYGRLLEGSTGYTHSGLDIDALRMYLRWRELTLSELRAAPERYRDPRSLPERFGDPTDGAVADGEPIADGGQEFTPAIVGIDWWGAETFLSDIDGTAYGTTPTTLREGLNIVAHNKTLWISPGIPFIIPLFIGLVLALTYGDILLTLLRAINLAS
jgi:preflagellin peptidase FlaK